MKDEITIRYKIEENKRVKLFGYFFIQNNINNFKIKINGKDMKLIEIINTENIIKDNTKELEIKLIKIQEIKDLSYMFSGCKSLLSLPDLSLLNTSNIIDMSYMFYECSSLFLLSDISTWDTSNVIYMKNMFSYCTSLTSLPDISKWDISNAIDISYIFSSCYSLTSLPDI